MAGWRDYLGLLPFVRFSQRPPEAQPSINMLRATVVSRTSAVFDVVSHLEADSRQTVSPLRRIL